MKENIMEKQKMRFFCDYGGFCLWQNGALDVKSLKLSEELEKQLIELNNFFEESLNWKNPLAESPWSDEDWERFFVKTDVIFSNLVGEIGDTYEIVNENRLYYTKNKE
jgi:hypothetical protein